MTMTPNANWLAKNDASTKQPIYAVNFPNQDADIWYHTHEITGATGDHYKYLVDISAVSHTFNRIRSESSIGGFTFELLTSAGLWNFDELYQVPVIVKGGYAGLNWSDYEVIAPTSYIQDINNNDGNTGFVFSCQDLQQQTDFNIFTAATVASPDVISARNPITFWLQVMTTVTGDTSNGPYDVLEASQGLAIDENLIDVTECELIRDDFYIATEATWTFNAEFNAKDFFQEDIFRSFALTPVLKKNGKMSLRAMLPPLLGYTQDNDMGSKLTDAEILDIPDYKTSYRDIVNRVIFKFDYDYVDGEYDTSTTFNGPNSGITAFTVKGVYPITIESKGIKTANDGVALTQLIANRYFQRYEILPALVRVQTKFSERIVEAADMLEITSAEIPNPDDSNFTVTSRGYEVEQVTPNFEAGVVDITLRDVNFGEKKYGVISTAGMVDFGSASAVQKSTYCWVDQGYKII